MAKADERMLGKMTGATKRADGSIVIAPMHGDNFKSLHDREVSLRGLLTITNEFVVSGLESVHKDRRRWWDRVCDDLSLDRNAALLADYDGDQVVIRPAPRDVPDKAEGSQE